MPRANLYLRGILALTAACVFVLPFAGFARAQTVQESSAENRFQLDFHVPDAALAALLPAGWTSAVASQGPAKDANLRVVFIDRMTMNGPDGKPVGKGSNRQRSLVAPVKDPTGATVQLVMGGLYGRSGGCSRAVRGLSAGDHSFDAAHDFEQRGGQRPGSGPRLAGLGVCLGVRRAARDAREV